MEFAIKIFIAVGMNLLENFYGLFHVISFITIIADCLLINLILNSGPYPGLQAVKIDGPRLLEIIYHY